MIVDPVLRGVVFTIKIILILVILIIVIRNMTGPLFFSVISCPDIFGQCEFWLITIHGAVSKRSMLKIKIVFLVIF